MVAATTKHNAATTRTPPRTVTHSIVSGTSGTAILRTPNIHIHPDSWPGANQLLVLASSCSRTRAIPDQKVVAPNYSIGAHKELTLTPKRIGPHAREISLAALRHASTLPKLG